MDASYVPLGCLWLPCEGWILDQDKCAVVTGKRILQLTFRNLAGAALSWTKSHLPRFRRGEPAGIPHVARATRRHQ